MRLLTIFLLIAIYTSHEWILISNVWLVGYLLEKTIDLALALVMAKALSREARRYLETRGPRV